MKPAPFDYRAAHSVAEAIRLLGDGDREIKVLAGGQSLLPVLNMRMGHPDVLVDICRIPELGSIDVDSQEAVHIGAAVRQAQAHADPRLRSGWPVLTEAIGHIGHPQIRNRGTVCGSLAHNDPASELPAVAVALDAELVARSQRGLRRLNAADFFDGPFSTVLEEDELLTEVVFPRQPAWSGSSFQEFSTRVGDFATAGVVVRLERAGDVVSAARLVFFGVGGSPVRVAAAEQALLDAPVTPSSTAAAVSALEEQLDPVGDIHATAAFRKELAAQLAVTGINQAWERCA
ncbi:FAD binding domain-containing protein [Leekyejoonella antrihumi]|uniref:Xanthine dehydrogenase family protein subunit M n=1 Tax=Leekyejoonella antrihumi TaxID=1660198 RepID=A0A563DXK8_9MICO|nr:xanthine dehydrogenase family protein subunit M [Leekyejoonella antrihumi]TWP34673.1 xanthine dehydrogenase family protein subunit M [Leekyejoonella antrihumi]